jgi:protein-tyrosine sulfotransferase
MNRSGVYEGVVVLGFPRSGTTLLRRLLNAHPALCCPPETNVLNACARFLYEEEIAGGVQFGVLGGLAFSGVPEDTVLQRLRDLAFGLLRDIATQAGKPRWVEKSPHDVFHLDAIERLCGDRCRYLSIVRHPLDVVCSTKELCDKLEIFPGALHEYVRRHQAPLEAFAHAWADTHRRLLQFEQAHPDGCLRVRYEDLIAETPLQLDRIFQFLGEPADTEQIVARAMAGRDTVGLGDWKTYGTNDIDSKSVGRWRELPPERIARLAAIVEPLLAPFGYEPIVVESAGDQERARHLHQMRLWVTRLTADVAARKTARERS